MESRKKRIHYQFWGRESFWKKGIPGGEPFRGGEGVFFSLLGKKGRRFLRESRGEFFFREEI